MNHQVRILNTLTAQNIDVRPYMSKTRKLESNLLYGIIRTQDQINDCLLKLEYYTAKIPDIIASNNVTALRWQLVDSASKRSRKSQLVARNNSIRLSWGSPHHNS